MVTRDTAQRGDAQATYFVHIRLALITLTLIVEGC